MSLLLLGFVFYKKPTVLPFHSSGCVKVDVKRTQVVVYSNLELH